MKLPFIVQELLQVANDRLIDLDNFCFYCKIIKSNRTFHCMYCKKCIDKFDHHCPYINNCLGYKNHKYFLIFIIAIFIYFITSLIVCISSFFKIDDSDCSIYYKIFITWLSRCYTLLLDLISFVPLMYFMTNNSVLDFKSKCSSEESSLRINLIKMFKEIMIDGLILKWINLNCSLHMVKNLLLRAKNTL